MRSLFQNLRYVSLAFAFVCLVNCSSSITAGPPPPGPSPTLQIDSWTDESGDSIVVSGESISVRGSGLNNFTLATNFSLEGIGITPTSVAKDLITFIMPPRFHLGTLTFIVSNGSMSTSTTLTHQKMILTVAQNLDRLIVGTIDASGVYTDRHLRLETGHLPQDVVVSPDGRFGYVTSSVTGVLAAHYLPGLRLTNPNDTYIPAIKKINLGQPLRGVGINFSGSLLIVEMEYFSVPCQCTLKEASIVSTGTSGNTVNFTIIDIESGQDGIQNISIPGANGSGLRSIRGGLNGTIAVGADAASSLAHVFNMNSTGDGIANEVTLSSNLSFPARHSIVSHDDNLAVITGYGHPSIDVLDTHTGFVTVIPLLPGDLTAEGSAITRDQSILLIPTLGHGIQAYDATSLVPGSWIAISEIIAPTTATTSTSSIDILSDKSFALWLADETLRVISVPLINDGIVDNEIIGSISFSGRGSTEFAIQE